LKYILAVVFILLVATLYFVLGPDRTFEAGKLEEIPVTDSEDSSATVSNETEKISAEDKRRAAMHEEFEKLEKARRNLERKLSRLKALLWDLKFPAKKSADIKEQMQTGYALLKNKKLLGAYYGLNQIEDELGQVDFVYQNLQKIEQQIREIKNKQPE